MKLNFKKTTALTTLVLFLYNTLSYSAPSVPEFVDFDNSILSAEVQFPAFELDIPATLGKVEHLSQGSRQGGVVIHIQDAHGSFEAQANINRLLRFLKKQYGVRTVFLEGGVSTLNPGYFRFFDEPAKNQRIAKRLMRQGLLSGAETFLIEQGKEAEGFGIESRDAYRTDIGLFRKVLTRSEESLEFVRTIERRLQILEAKIMSRELRRFLKSWRSHHKDPSSLLRFAKTLEKQAQQTLRLDLTDAVNQGRVPALLRILKMKDLEPVLNSSKAAEEREALIKALLPKLGKDGEKAGDIDFDLYPDFK